MKALVALALAMPGRAVADAALDVRVFAAAGQFEEITWTAPGVDLIGSLERDRWSLSLAAGYVPIDSHVFLADGEIVHGAVSGGWHTGALRLSGVLDVAYVAYHGDPDLLAEHPNVDLLARRGGVTPFLGFELAHRFTAVASAGVFAKVALRELTVFDDEAGDRARARLVLAGAFLDLRIR